MFICLVSSVVLNHQKQVTPQLSNGGVWVGSEGSTTKSSTTDTRNERIDSLVFVGLAVFFAYPLYSSRCTQSPTTSHASTIEATSYWKSHH